MGGVRDGARTRDNRNHNPGLCQLSYSHHYDLTRFKILLESLPIIEFFINMSIKSQAKMQLIYSDDWHFEFISIARSSLMFSKLSPISVTILITVLGLFDPLLIFGTP